MLDFVTRLKAERHADHDARRKRALAILTKYRGRLEAVRTGRDELHDREVSLNTNIAIYAENSNVWVRGR